MSILVHHLQFSRSLRILWLLEELALPYEMRVYERTPEFRAPAELKKVHPLGRAPVVEVDDLVLAESAAIIDHFCQEALRPSQPQELVDYRFFLHFAEGSLMPPLLVQFILSRLEDAPLPFFIRPIARKIAGAIRENFLNEALSTQVGFVESTLSQRSYVAGETFSAADIQMYYPIEVALSRAPGDWPALRAWRERVRARPAFLRAEEKGGPAVPE